MSWTNAEAKAEDRLIKAFGDCGIEHYFRDFADDSDIQGLSYIMVYVVGTDNTSDNADNDRIAFDVNFTIYLGTTDVPTSDECRAKREKLENAVHDSGFIVRFTKSGFDPDTKLYVFEYSVKTKETA